MARDRKVHKMQKAINLLMQAPSGQRFLASVLVKLTEPKRRAKLKAAKEAK